MINLIDRRSIIEIMAWNMNSRDCHTLFGGNEEEPIARGWLVITGFLVMLLMLSPGACGASNAHTINKTAAKEAVQDSDFYYDSFTQGNVGQARLLYTYDNGTLKEQYWVVLIKNKSATVGVVGVNINTGKIGWEMRTKSEFTLPSFSQKQIREMLQNEGLSTSSYNISDSQFAFIGGDLKDNFVVVPAKSGGIGNAIVIGMDSGDFSSVEVSSAANTGSMNRTVKQFRDLQYFRNLDINSGGLSITGNTDNQSKNGRMSSTSSEW